MVASSLAGRSVLAIAHRVELCKQIDAEFQRQRMRDCTVAGVAAQRTPALLQSGKFDTLFVDEAHHIAAASYRRLAEHRRDMVLIGATATPYRADGASLKPFFDEVVMAPSAQELSHMGYLSDVTYVSSDSVDYAGIKLSKKNEFEEADALRRVRVAVQAGDVVRAWGRYAKGKNALIYAINLEHCESVKAELLAAGVPCDIVSSRAGKRERASLVDRFESRKLRALINCEVFTEGTDLKGVGVITMLRPTNSRGLYKQMIGRGLRPDVSCTVLDHVGNFLRHGNVLVENPLDAMRAARLRRAATATGEVASSLDVKFERMELHVEKIDADLAPIWTPSVFRAV